MDMPMPTTTTTVDAGSSPSTTSTTVASGGTTTTNSGFVTRSGENLMLNGQKIQFVGFDTYGIAGCYNQAWTTAQMDAYLSGLPANGLTRIFAFQSWGTSAITTFVNEAAKYHQHVMIGLADGNSSCQDHQDAPGGDGSGKTLAFYQSDWKGAYLTWVNTIVPQFKNNTTVAMWEIINEPFHAGATGVDAATMKSFFDGAAAAIKADDPNHLTEVGAADTGDLGGASTFAQVLSGPNIDVLNYHDYSWDFQNRSVTSSNFAELQQAAKTDNKPYMIGETGVEAGSSCNGSNGMTSLSARQSYLQQKTSTYLAAGLSAIIYWDYEPADAYHSCDYEIFPGDPMIAYVKGL